MDAPAPRDRLWQFLGLPGLEKRYGLARLEAACRPAVENDMLLRRLIVSILIRGYEPLAAVRR